VTLSNLKLGFGVFAVLLTALAQFFPLPFPDNASFLKVCVLVYFAIQGLLQLLHLLVEKDCILLTKRHSSAAGEEDAAGSKSAAPADAKKTALQQHQQKLMEQQKKKKGGAAAPASSPVSASSSSSIPSEYCVPNLPPFAVSLQASLARHSTDYQLTLATRTSESVFASLHSSSSANSGTVNAAGVPLVAVSVALSITDYFDAEGIFLMERYHKSMQELLQAFAEEVKRVTGEDAQPTKEGKKVQ
jgi:predicted protein tyrosine phosphatase